MHWRYRKLKYDILIPPLGKHVFKLSEQEAAAYFDWYMEKIPERVAYVSKVCAKELRIPEEKLDRSPESLLLLWKWFRKRARTERIPGEKQDKRQPKELWKPNRQLTLETEYILRDIGMYLGETFRKNDPQLYWTYYTKPRRDFFVNHPLLKGFVDRSFGKTFEPIHMARVQASKLLRKKSKDTDLLNIYQIWMEKTDRDEIPTNFA